MMHCWLSSDCCNHICSKKIRQLTWNCLKKEAIVFQVFADYSFPKSFLQQAMTTMMARATKRTARTICMPWPNALTAADVPNVAMFFMIIWISAANVTARMKNIGMNIILLTFLIYTAAAARASTERSWFADPKSAPISA